MTFSEWIDAEAGRATAVARHFNLTVAAVSQWKTNGVPKHRMLAVRRLTRNRVTLEAMLAPRVAA